MVIVFPKAKVAARKWIYAVRRREVKVKEKIKYDKSFVPCESLKKAEWAEDLEIILGKAMEDPGAIKMSNFNKDIIMPLLLKENQHQSPAL